MNPAERLPDDIALDLFGLYHTYWSGKKRDYPTVGEVLARALADKVIDQEKHDRYQNAWKQLAEIPLCRYYVAWEDNRHHPTGKEDIR